MESTTVNLVRQCSKCDRHGSSAWYKNNICKTCYMKVYNLLNREYYKKRYLLNRNKYTQYSKKYYLLNRDKAIDYRKKWYLLNRDKHIENHKKWYLLNHDKQIEYFKKLNRSQRRKEYLRIYSFNRRYYG